VGAVGITAAWTSQSTEINLLNATRHLAAPPQLDWVDAHARGDVVGTLDIGKPQALRGNLDLYTDFFNKKVDPIYSTVTTGGTQCNVRLGAGGYLTHTQSDCTPWPRELVVQKAQFKTTLRGQQVLATTPNHGALVRIPAGPPRVLALVRPPCNARSCTGVLNLGLYLEKPGHVTVTFGRASSAYLATAGGTAHVLPPGRVNTFTIPVARGDKAVNVEVNWAQPTGTPRLKSVVLHSAGENSRLW
jgi:hypothetical protein